ncbi:hypothetical protein [Mycobacterium sp. DL592]|uniref:hypothetical protein n=1 Tax=Mycobacterium sp. DL592 TaxID=2675524 RepID=UPI0014211D15|nr:hypothetical protein [Mycobacterium sp. DL592]
MTVHSVTSRSHRGAKGAAIGVLTAALIAGLGSATALADPSSTAPATPTAQSDSGVPQFKSADELLLFIDQEYDQGAGGGQLSNLIKSVMKLRSQGFKPSKTNVAAIMDALNYRPNQKPLIQALSDTLGYQQKIKAQTEMLQQAQAAQNNNAVMGAGQMPSDGSPSIPGQ